MVEIAESYVMVSPGIAVALACAFILKRFQIAGPGEAENTGGIAFSGKIYEITIVIMSAYLAYLVAEVGCYVLRVE